MTKGIDPWARFPAPLRCICNAAVDSISLTDDEADAVNDRSSGNSSWGLANKTAEKNDDGFYEASVTVDVGKDKKTTNTKVYSEDGNVWMSNNYRTEAKKAEED